MTGTIRQAREYDASPEELWDLIATSDGLAAWLMPNDFEPVVGHRFTFTDRPRPPLYDGVVGCTVLEVEPRRRLRISWTGGPVDTILTLTLTERSPGRTRLDLEHTGFSGLKGTMVRGILGLGWRGLVRRTIPTTLVARRNGVRS